VLRHRLPRPAVPAHHGADAAGLQRVRHGPLSAQRPADVAGLLRGAGSSPERCGTSARLGTGSGARGARESRMRPAMFSSTYHFVTDWRVEATPEEVYRVLDEPTELVRWWPAVYLDVREEQTERGQVYTLLTRGWLPYTLRWQLRRTEKVPF